MLVRGQRFSKVWRWWKCALFSGGLCPQKSVSDGRSSPWLCAAPCDGWMKRKITFERFSPAMWKQCYGGRSFRHCSADCKQTELLLNEPYPAIVFPSAVPTTGSKFTKSASKLVLIRVCEMCSWSCFSSLSPKLDSDQSFLDNENSEKYAQSRVVFTPTLIRSC